MTSFNIPSVDNELQQSNIDSLSRLLNTVVTYNHTTTKQLLEDLLEQQEINWSEYFDELLVVNEKSITGTTVNFTFDLQEFTDVDELLSHCKQLSLEVTEVTKVDKLDDDLCMFSCGYFRDKSGFCSLHRHCDAAVYSKQHSLALKRQRIAWLRQTVDFLKSALLPQHFCHQCEDGSVINFSLAD